MRPARQRPNQSTDTGHRLRQRFGQRPGGVSRAAHLTGAAIMSVCTVRRAESGEDEPQRLATASTISARQRAASSRPARRTLAVPSAMMTAPNASPAGLWPPTKRKTDGAQDDCLQEHHRDHRQ